jgi:hypothetical protein
VRAGDYNFPGIGLSPQDQKGFVAKLHLRRFVLWSLPVTYGV